MSNKKDFATSTIATAPSPADTGTSLDVQTGHGARFPAAPFYVTVHPPAEFPTLDNAEKLLVTAKSSDTFTVTRAQGDTTAQMIEAGWRISNAMFLADIPATFDDLTDGTTNKAYTATEQSKLAGIEASADVTDSTNVDAAGAVMNADTAITAMGFVLDEDDMASDSATKLATQQSIKAYIDAQIANSGTSSGYVILKNTVVIQWATGSTTLTSSGATNSWSINWAYTGWTPYVIACDIKTGWRFSVVGGAEALSSTDVHGYYTSNAGSFPRSATTYAIGIGIKT